MSNCKLCTWMNDHSHTLVYENDWVACFLDENPINKGHIRVVPKKHYVGFSDVDGMTLFEVIHTAQRLTKALEEVLNPEGFTVFSEHSDLEEEHFYLEVVPRFKKDEFEIVVDRKKLTSEEIETLVQLIRSNFN